MATRGKRLKEAREEAGLTQEQVGKLFSPPISRNAVALWEAGTTTPESDKLLILARAYKRSVDFLLGGRTNTAREPGSPYNVSMGPDIRSEVPLISWVHAGKFAEATDNFRVGDAEEWFPMPKRAGPNTYCLRVEGDSMTAPHGRSYPAGSIIFVDPDQRSPANGRRVIAKLDGSDEVTFKVFVQESGRIFLKPLNALYPPILDPFKVIGTVIGKWEDE